MLDFLRARAIAGVEVVDDERYLRTVEVNGKMGSIEVMHLPDRQSLGVSIRFPDVRLLPAIVARVRRLFDLGADIETIDEHLSGDRCLRRWWRSVRGCGLRAVGMVLRLRCGLCWGSRSVWLLHGDWLVSLLLCMVVWCRSRF